MKEIKLGTKSKCKACARQIIFTGRFWEHVRFTPRHPAILQEIIKDTKEEQKDEDQINYKT